MTNTNKNTTDPYKGVRDFYPTDWTKLQTLFTRIRKTLSLYGYEEYNASPLERAELYESKGNEEIVREQTYTFVDRGDRRVTLRPEMTPTLARMVSARRRELPMPLRWFSIPNVFRYERPQRGRLREHYQLNVDIIGKANTMQADQEIIFLAARILLDFGAHQKDFIIRINDRALLTQACEDAGITGERSRHYMRLLDKKDKISKDDFDIALKEISDIDPLVLIERAKDSPDSKIGKILRRLEEYKENLASERSLTSVVVDPTITRGFDYYTGMVFEVSDTHPENLRALFGGGRYDELTGLFGGDPIPAVGFGMGDITLADFLETHGLTLDTSSTPTLFLGTVPNIDNSAPILRGAIETIAETLRVAGISVFVGLTTKSVGDQVKESDKRGIPYFAVIGPKEITSQTLRVKCLKTGEEQELTIAAVAAFCTT